MEDKIVHAAISFGNKTQMPFVMPPIKWKSKANIKCRTKSTGM